MPRFRHVVVGAGVPETTLSKLPVEVRVVQADWLSTLALEQLDKRRVCEAKRDSSQCGVHGSTLSLRLFIAS